MRHRAGHAVPYNPVRCRAAPYVREFISVHVRLHAHVCSCVHPVRAHVCKPPVQAYGRGYAGSGWPAEYLEGMSDAERAVMEAPYHPRMNRTYAEITSQDVWQCRSHRDCSNLYSGQCTGQWSVPDATASAPVR